MWICCVMYNSSVNLQHVAGMKEWFHFPKPVFFPPPPSFCGTGQRENRPLDKFQLTFPMRTNYMYAKVKKSLPEMYALTVCMWLKSNASPGVGTPFSYAVPGQANELVLIEWGNSPMEILINDKVCLFSVFEVMPACVFTCLLPPGGEAAFPHQRREVAPHLRDLDDPRRRLGGFSRWSQEGERGESGAVSSHQAPGPADPRPGAGKHAKTIWASGPGGHL